MAKRHMRESTSRDLRFDEELRQIARRMQAGVTVADRTKQLKKHRRIFLGQDAVDWMVARVSAGARSRQYAVRTREDAVELGQKMMDMSLIYRVSIKTRAHIRMRPLRFKDSPKAFFRFNEALLGKYLLRVNIREATNLLGKHRNGCSSPYVTLETLREKCETRIILENLNPVWDENFILSINDPQSEMIVATIWNWMDIGAHHFLGRVQIRVADILDLRSDAVKASDEYKISGEQHAEDTLTAGKGSLPRGSPRNRGAAPTFAESVAPEDQSAVTADVQWYALQKRGKRSHVQGEIGLRMSLHDFSFSEALRLRGLQQQQQQFNIFETIYHPNGQNFGDQFFSGHLDSSVLCSPGSPLERRIMSPLRTKAEKTALMKRAAGSVSKWTLSVELLNCEGVRLAGLTLDDAYMNMTSVFLPPGLEWKNYITMRVDSRPLVKLKSALMPKSSGPSWHGERLQIEGIDSPLVGCVELKLFQVVGLQMVHRELGIGAVLLDSIPKMLHQPPETLEDLPFTYIEVPFALWASLGSKNRANNGMIRCRMLMTPSTPELDGSDAFITSEEDMQEEEEGEEEEEEEGEGNEEGEGEETRWKKVDLQDGQNEEQLKAFAKSNGNGNEAARRGQATSFQSASSPVSARKNRLTQSSDSYPQKREKGRSPAPQFISCPDPLTNMMLSCEVPLSVHKLTKMLFASNSKFNERRFKQCGFEDFKHGQWVAGDWIHKSKLARENGENISTPRHRRQPRAVGDESEVLYRAIGIRRTTPISIAERLRVVNFGPAGGGIVIRRLIRVVGVDSVELVWQYSLQHVARKKTLLQISFEMRYPGRSRRCGMDLVSPEKSLLKIGQQDCSQLARLLKQITGEEGFHEYTVRHQDAVVTVERVAVIVALVAIAISSYLMLL